VAQTAAALDPGDPCREVVRAGGAAPLVDDFEDNNEIVALLEARNGYWVTVTDTDPAKIGFDVRRDGHPWGAAAKRYVSIDYRAAKRLRLAAHRCGDGDREYCVDGYRSGEFVDARRFRVGCGEVAGEALPSFEGVDKLTLEQPAADDATTFDYCITAIAVGDDADASAAGAPPHG
jgi:hypothetical protein